MAVTSDFTAPNNAAGYVISNNITGNTYTSNAAGVFVGVASNDTTAMLQNGCKQITIKDVANFRNLIDGGDFTTNPWQRGTTFSSGIANTLTYTADRFFVIGGASSAITVAQSSITLASFQYGLQFGRTSSNSSAVAIWMGQVLESADCYRTQGQEVTLSFWASIGSSFSASSSSMSVLLNYGTSSNQSASSMMASSWSGFTSIINSSLVLTSTLTRYQFTATLPATVSQIGIQLGYTPSNAASASDYIVFAGIQLEIAPEATNFEHHDIAYDVEACQRYAVYFAEPSSGVAIAAGYNKTSSNQVFFMPTPVTMRVAPTVTVSSGSWVTAQGSSTSSGTISSGTTHTVNALTINCNATGTLGQGSLLLGGGGTGWILASADY